MGERLLCKQEVIGSIPFTSTTATITIRSIGEKRPVLRRRCVRSLAPAAG